MIIPKLMNYFSQHNGITDIEYLNGVIYLSTMHNGIFGYELYSIRPYWQNPFKAEAMQTWGECLILIGSQKKQYNEHESEAVFEIIDTRTRKTIVKTVELPRKNYLTKYIRRTITGKEVVEHATETAPYLSKAFVIENKLYILYRFNKENGVTGNKVNISFSEESVICVYSLLNLKLVNHYELGSIYSFCVHYPYICYLGSGFLYTLDVTNYTIRSVKIYQRKNGYFTLMCDRNFVYITCGENCSDHLSIYKISDLSFIETINLSKQMSALTRSVAMEYDNIFKNQSEIFNFTERLEKTEEHFKQKYCHPIELKGFIREASNRNGCFNDIHGMCFCDKYDILAIVTETGANPGFLWDAQTRQPVAYLFGNHTVSRSIKIRYPYLLSRAFEDAHVWQLI